jgi:NAD(P)-dependent dehydrogenase (short-subunit alcohol dehydrogenase family)
MGRLEGKTVLITGAARGIGAAAARLFVAEGARLMLADVREEPLQALSEELGEAVAAFRTVDVTDEAAVARLVEDAVRHYGRLDVALLNAGISGQPHALVDTPAAQFDQVFAVNVRGVWLGLKHAMKAMQSRGGSIVVTASTASIRATPNMAAYVASKHATLGLMRAAALEGATHGIRVNSVNPATIDTPMVQELAATSAQRRQPSVPLTQLIPMGRHGTADEVARLMLYLASDESSFCTGGVYMVDGGVSAGRAF